MMQDDSTIDTSCADGIGDRITAFSCKGKL